MGVMDNFEQKVDLLEVGIYGFGPWFTYNQQGENYKNNFEPIVYDWLNFFNPLINDVVTDRSLVIQAGGWQGVYPFLLSNMFAQVYTFEPDPINFYVLTKNCQRNNIHKFQAALSDVAGLVTFELTNGSGQNRVVHDKHEMFYLNDVIQTVTLPAVTIDSLNVPNLGLLMLDVENYENQVIDGAIKTIEKYKPVVCIEKSFIPANDELIATKLSPFGYTKLVENHMNIVFKVA